MATFTVGIDTTTTQTEYTVPIEGETFTLRVTYSTRGGYFLLDILNALGEVVSAGAKITTGKQFLRTESWRAIIPESASLWSVTLGAASSISPGEGELGSEGLTRLVVYVPNG